MEAHLEVSSVVIERMSAAGLKKNFGFVYFDFFPLASLVRVHMSSNTAKISEANKPK